MTARLKNPEQATRRRGGLGAPEVKLLAEPPGALTSEGVFSGYASLFGVADLGRDVVVPGAFTETLARRGAGGIRMLWQHDPAEPVGRWISLVEDARGLRVSGRLNLEVRRAREIAAMMRDGSVDGLSIGFRVEEARPDRGLRRLRKIDLWEISIVTFPMMPGARVEAIGRPPVASRSGPAERPTASATSAIELRLADVIRRAARRLKPSPIHRPSPGRKLETRP